MAVAEHDVDLRDALRAFTAGVTVVTTRHEGRVHGITVTAFAGVSLDPPQVLACVAKESMLHDLLGASGLLGVSILASGQEHLADAFARPGDLGPSTMRALTVTGDAAPAVAGAAAFLDCRVADVFDGSSHAIVLGGVVATTVDHRRAPLVYHDRAYRTLRGWRAAPRRGPSRPDDELAEDVALDHPLQRRSCLGKRPDAVDHRPGAGRGQEAGEQLQL